MNNTHVEVGIAPQTPESQTVNMENVTCPICFKSFSNLVLLNTHLDNDHGFNDSIDDSSPTVSKQQATSQEKKRNIANTKSKNIKVLAKVNKIKTGHWKAYTSGSKCHDCGHILKSKSEARNCRKCGNLFSKWHCRNVIRLNLKADYDPENGKWYNCCQGCYIMRPGYNDFGSRVDLTETFCKIRYSKSDDRELRRLQLENRLVVLINGIIILYNKYHDSILGPVKLDYNITTLERSTVPWRDDSTVSNCNICHTKFTFLLRKHHCRLCGSIVCDKIETCCSNELLIRFLQAVTSDLNYTQSVPEDPEFDKGIRICSNCLDMIYVPRKFKKDISALPTAIISKYYSLQNLSVVINQVLPKFEDLLSKIEITRELNNVPDITDVRELGKHREKLLRAFKAYNILTKQVVTTRTTNISEKRIQESIKIISSDFINEKILPMKNLPTILNSGSSSNESSTNNSFMDTGTPEVKKLSDLMSDLTIKEIKEYREELMVFKEQSFMLQSMIKDSKKQRHFDEVQVLSNNLKDIKKRVDDIQNKLGEQGFD
ncbi:similar to Saccharomyces cerevisiae YDR323C PEP7 Multivalent adaptor protein that facilitates vesicle-mediated vacuolar protein sorting by ensuring high-fidelity vesicle docking and fusion [Maudiozyma saulgeensis]|uniref:Similar to Saccharomyces cerevisiae YDR323C PEP7 Multivalent adaptor protein that facilitates vesicle-mediated vacuolar protein sorting by ensuring high-fidelity vesicle docking and fusion n=1 Tax=Maudiozyma saulgeensis TaxID=1789683 RepID=A0A1X7R393_9SACH|nr:similar to Saccharomyces cerevisiae YDR323C PEP7 Multivalent adaptor protein that facilitates vesicle-mediated vacuolar protein sorting by ensuring high-fidelity vesicle docking and fusion [Kazachstania saulgeensis]